MVVEKRKSYHSPVVYQITAEQIQTGGGAMFHRRV
jgi:hypothetical protein